LIDATFKLSVDTTNKSGVLSDSPIILYTG